MTGNKVTTVNFLGHAVRLQYYDCDACHHVRYCDRLGKTNCPDYHPLHPALQTMIRRILL